MERSETMANETEVKTEEAAQPLTKEDKKKMKEEQKRLKQEMKQLKKEQKEARALAEDDEGGGALSVILVTIFIVLIWVAILLLLIKLDVGGFGSNVLRPVLKDVPVINKILPAPKASELEEAEQYMGYSSLADAVKRIKELELELQEAQAAKNADSDTVVELQNEIKRLKTFEDNQVEFEKIKNEFYNEVVFAENAPNVEEYKKYYEQIDPTNAEQIYRQVVEQVQTDDEIQKYAAAYSAMKPKQAAGIFEAMTDNLELAAKILHQMSADDRGKILGVMDSEVAARLTKIMDPDDLRF